jgi:hypothetical protein
VIEMLPLEATGIRFNLPSKLALWFDPTILHANAFMAIWCLHATFHNNAQPGSSPVLPDDD